jgi:hypothetical protein
MMKKLLSVHRKSAGLAGMLTVGASQEFSLPGRMPSLASRLPQVLCTLPIIVGAGLPAIRPDQSIKM